MMLQTNMCNLMNYKSFIEINLCIYFVSFNLFRPVAVARSRPLCPGDHPLVVVRPSRGEATAADSDWWELAGFLCPTLCPTFRDVPHVPQMGHKWGTKSSPPQPAAGAVGGPVASRGGCRTFWKLHPKKWYTLSILKIERKCLKHLK